MCLVSYCKLEFQIENIYIFIINVNIASLNIISKTSEKMYMSIEKPVYLPLYFLLTQ